MQLHLKLLLLLSVASDAVAVADAYAAAAADAAYGATYDAASDAVASEAYDKQVKLNMQIAKKHCPLPWSEGTDEPAGDEQLIHFWALNFGLYGPEMQPIAQCGNIRCSCIRKEIK